MSLSSIRSRVEAATPGPWDWEDPYRLEQPLEFGMVVTYIDRFESKPSPADRTFIAHARQDIPALLRVAEAAAAVLERSLHGACEEERCPYYALRAALAELEALP
jgi:hypothetical protein